MSTIARCVRANPRLTNVAARPASPGKFNISPRFTSQLQARGFAAAPNLPQQRAIGPSRNPRDEGFKTQHPSQPHEQRFAAQARGPPQPPQKEYMNLESGKEAPTFLGTTKRLPEFNLADKVVLVSGGARGLGLVQAEALLEAGATGELQMLSFFHCISTLTMNSLLPRPSSRALAIL